jgi:hypothetical protein
VKNKGKVEIKSSGTETEAAPESFQTKRNYED